MKRLITANTIHQEKAAGHTTLEVSLPECIVTPEARLVASQVGITIIEKVGGGSKQQASGALGVTQPNKTDIALIRQAIVAKLPAKLQLDEQLITQLIEKTITTQLIKKSPASASTSANIAGHQGIKCVPANTIEMGIFSEAGPENEVGIADVITAEDGSPMAGGFMSWKDCFFPWTLNYDEIDLVLEGELHIRHKGQTFIGKAGDVLFIPKGSSIEFGTPTSVRFFYVAHPANWQDC